MSNEAHFAALTKLRDIIRESELVDSHPDYKKGTDGKRSAENGINQEITIDVIYGAMSLKENVYRVKTTLKRYANADFDTKAYAYNVSEIEVLPGTLGGLETQSLPTGNTSITGNILLQGIRDSKGNAVIENVNTESYYQSDERTVNEDRKQQEKRNRYIRKLSDRATQIIIKDVKARERADSKITLSELKQQYKEILKNTKAEYNAKIADIKDKQSESLRKTKDRRIRNEARARLRKYYADRRIANRTAKLKERIAKLKQEQKLMKERQRERQKIRDRVGKIRKALTRMSQAKNIIWARQQEIKNLLDTYDFTKNGNLSLRDYEFIHGQVKELYETGKRELAAKKLITQERVNKMRQEIMATMQKDWDNRPRGALRHTGETSKEYNGLRGKVSKLIDWNMANTMSAQRFFDFLDGGQKYQGAWSKYFSDEANKAYDEELRHKFARALDLEAFMREQGITAKKLAEVRNVKVPHQGNKGWTVDELLSVYAGMKNERSRMAILYGNFADAETIEQAEAWAADCVKALKEQEKALADYIIQEYEKHFDRINDAIIDIYNQGMEHEENYTPMRRIEYTSKRDGVLDPDAAENLMSSQQGSGFRSVERGFTKSRQDISAQNQKGIELGLVSMWYSQVELQEHAAAFGQLVSDLRKILMARTKDDEATVRQMVKQTRGLPAWTMIRQYFNLLATSDTVVLSLDYTQAYGKEYGFVCFCGVIKFYRKRKKSLSLTGIFASEWTVRDSNPRPAD